MSSHPNRWFTGGRMPIAAIALSVLLFAANARAQQPPPDPPQMCGEGVFTVKAPSGTLTLPKGCSMYLLIVSDHGRNNQMNELTFYPLAKWVAENGGYVHWAWWNNLLREYMAGPLGVATPVPFSFAGEPPSEPSALSSHHLFAAHPGTPTYVYPGMAERGWWKDGAAKILEPLLDFLFTDELLGTAPPSPATNASFVADARVFLSTIRNEHPPETLIFAVGHGFGAGSLNEVFEGLPDVDIDLVGLIDPVGSQDTPQALRTNLNTHRGSQWRAKRSDFKGYRQADCIRNTSFPFFCTNHASGFLQFDYRCEPFGRPADTASGWLAAPPTISSRAPLQCSGPVVHGGTLYKTFASAPKIRQIVRRFQPESRVPINPSQSVSPLLTCRSPMTADPILKAIVDQAAGHEGALPLPESLQGTRNATLDCNPDDGHDELIGDRGISTFFDSSVLGCEFDFGNGFALPWLAAIATNGCDVLDGLLMKAVFQHLLRPGNATGPVDHQSGRVPYGTMVTGLGRNGLSEVQEYLASIGRPTPTEAWPACAICDSGPSGLLNARDILPLDMVYSANTQARRQALVSMATPGPWALQPPLPELCLVCDELIEIASGMLDENTPDDTASPTTTAQVSPEPNDSGWTGVDTVVTLSATDNPGGSGVREIAVSTSGAESSSIVHTGASAETPISTEGITTVTFAASDNEDNAESPAQTIVVRIDKTAPAIESVAVPPPNAFGWNNSDVTVSYTAADALSGLAELSPAAPTVVSAEGKDQEITGYAIDRAGNESAAGPTVSIDKTPPEIFAVADVPPNGDGWNNSDVGVRFDASDALSGIASSSPEVVVSAEGAAQTIAGSAEDRAGNTANTSVTLNIDRTVPQITASADAPNSFGWNNGDVRVRFIASDTLSGLASTSPDVVVSTEGGDQEIIGTARDRAGNEANAAAIVNIDKTAPQIAAVPATAVNSNGWHNTDVVVRFEASDALSGIAVSSPDVVVSTEGAAQSVSGTATDKADHTATASVVVNLDKTAPLVTAAVDIAPNSFGWNNSDVRVSFTASDALSGLASTSPETLVSAEGADQQITGTATDRADNTANASVILNIDKTAPQITAAANVAPNSFGWNSGDVVVSFAASDGLSGLAFSSPDVVVSTEGAGQAIAGTARDKADHTASASLVLNIDKTAPAIALASRTPANGAGWNNTDVTLTWNCSDALSGPVVTQVSHSLSAEGAAQNATGHCADRAGHTASDTQSGINIDKTSPASQITTPANGASYLLNAIVNATYGCADALSGVSACVGAVASGAALDTATVGDKTFTVSAADAAGNQAAASHSYSVQYAFSGFSNPLAALPAVNTANAGRTVPVKYSLRDVNGAAISDLTSFVSLISAPVACDSNVPTAAAEETDAAGSTTIHFESGLFVYNWKTQSAWQGTCRVLQLTLNDNTRHMVTFQFK